MRQTEDKGQIREGLTNGESSEEFKLQMGSDSQQDLPVRDVEMIEGRRDCRLQIEQGLT